VVAAKAWAFEKGWLRVRRLDAPVISVGSVSAGGAGKTPVVLLLAELLAREGLAVRILSRGYGRPADTVERVDPHGDAARFGDEPLLLARRVPEGAAVYVGVERFEAGALAEQDLRADGLAGGRAAFLLDDGFQHRRLGRDLDVVLLTERDVADVLLPAGNLRERQLALRRADVVVVREEEEAGLRERIGMIFGAPERGLGERPTGAHAAGRTPEVWVIRRRLVKASMPARTVVFSGIARPEGFVAMLAAEGCVPVAEVRFRDHHRYGDADVERLVRTAREVGADGFCTTEKDWVKLTPGMLARLEAVGPVRVAELRVELVNEAAAVARLRRLWSA